MLAKRVIPCLDVRDGRVVKSVSFAEPVDAGDAVCLASVYDEGGADELVFLDTTATQEGRRTFTELLRRVAEQVFVPLTVGGGVRSVEDFGRLLRAGADKVSVNAAAVLQPELLREAASQFGAQCVVLAIDAARDGGPGRRGRWGVYTHGGSRPTGLDVVEWALTGAELGAGEILVTSIHRDGRMTGYDIELTQAVARAVPVPVIASGGAGSGADLVAVFGEGEADAAMIASLLHFGRATIGDLKEDLRGAGVAVRDGMIG